MGTSGYVGGSWRCPVSTSAPASDDDPSGIATYSQAGAQYGPAFLWTARPTLPVALIVANGLDIAADLVAGTRPGQERGHVSGCIRPGRNGS